MSTLAIVGVSGVMGSTLKQRVQHHAWITHVVGITLTPTLPHEYASLDACHETIDVIIDFSVREQLPQTLAYATKHHIPCIIATTGLNDEDHQLIQQASQSCVVFVSANLSLGVYVLNQLLKKALGYLGSDVDIEMIDVHHTLKKDAPSGTAKFLANTISTITGKTMTTNSASDVPKDPNTFGVHALRLGKVVGEHSITIAFGSESLTLSHSALSKDIFAHGACTIAQSLLDLDYGLYTMDDIMKEKA